MTTISKRRFAPRATSSSTRGLGMQQARDAAGSWRDVDYALVAARVLRTTPRRSSNTSPVVNSVSWSHWRRRRSFKTSGHEVDGAGVLAVSQSGKSPGMIEVVRTARAQGRPNVVVTNDAHSPLALEGDSVVESSLDRNALSHQRRPSRRVVTRWRSSSRL